MHRSRFLPLEPLFYSVIACVATLIGLLKHSSSLSSPPESRLVPKAATTPTKNTQEAHSAGVFCTCDDCWGEWKNGQGSWSQAKTRVPFPPSFTRVLEIKQSRSQSQRPPRPASRGHGLWERNWKSSDRPLLYKREPYRL